MPPRAALTLQCARVCVVLVVVNLGREIQEILVYLTLFGNSPRGENYTSGFSGSGGGE